MRRALVTPDTDPFAHHPRFQEAPDNPQEILVAYTPCQTGHEDVVVDPIEELLQIQIGHDPMALGDVPPRLDQGAMGAPPQAEAGGHGGALLDRVVAANDLARGRLVSPFELSLATRFCHRIVSPEWTVDQPKVAAFREWLLAEAERHREADGSTIKDNCS